MSSNFFIGEKDYAESTRNVDSMLKQFEKDRNYVIDLLKNNPDNLVNILWKYNSPICKDDDCLFQMGKNLKLSIEDLLERKTDIADSMINFYICPQCKNMRRLIDFYDKSNIFTIECGEKAGSQLYYEEKDVCGIYLTKEKKPYSVKKAYENPFIKELAKCSSATCALPSKAAGDLMLKKYSDVEYLGTDKFTNNMLINWYLNKEINNSHLIKMYISFICSQKGYNLYEHLDIGNIGDFQDFPEFLTGTDQHSPTAKADDKAPICSKISKSIIVQLFACLHSLRKYDFSHGNPGTETLKFNKEVVSYIYDGVHVNGPVKMKLLDFSTSGCTVDNRASDKNKLRLYSKSVVADEELKKKTYEPIINTVVLNEETDKQVTVYSLRNPCKNIKSSILFMYMKHLGLPVYSSSFDAYSFMVVLMAERSFYSSVMNDKKLKSFWRSMFVNDTDYDKINYRLTDLHEDPKELVLQDVLITLSELSLRCDMIDFGWNLIKNEFC